MMTSPEDRQLSLFRVQGCRYWDHDQQNLQVAIQQWLSRFRAYNDTTKIYVINTNICCINIYHLAIPTNELMLLTHMEAKINGRLFVLQLPKIDELATIKIMQDESRNNPVNDRCDTMPCPLHPNVIAVSYRPLLSRYERCECMSPLHLASLAETIINRASPFGNVRLHIHTSPSELMFFVHFVPSDESHPSAIVCRQRFVNVIAQMSSYDSINTLLLGGYLFELSVPQQVYSPHFRRVLTINEQVAAIPQESTSRVTKRDRE